MQDVTGIQRVAIELVTALDELLAEGALPGLQVVVWAPARGDLVTVPRFRSAVLRRSGRLTSHAWEQLELPGLVGDEPLLCLGNLAPLSLLLTRHRQVHTMVHDLSYSYFPQAYSRSFRLLYSTLVPVVLARSQRVFTVSRSERDAILERHPRLITSARLTAVQNGGGEGAGTARGSADPATLEAGHPDVPARDLRDRRCLYVGSMTRRKNADGLARAAVELASTDAVDFHLVGGTGAQFGASGARVPEHLHDRVRLLGQVNDVEALEEQYRRASVFLFPSHYEASPLPPVEAMRFGCPVVAADIPSLRERCGDAVLYCDPHDVGSMTRQVRRLLDDPALWSRMQAAGLDRAAGFSWASQASTVLRHVVPA
ncbi:glycosyltransferase family 1 protein [Nocardioides sp. CFH 31398]|uniref:glycosyltransferase family 4 protein n=1 Tax=Nocardioides sp. CFH 31398 TaxID=2919579 RepID=UPI001F05CEEB|nr:glycosyltransferase family 1 protein [Nocardioides sp. CFH 31398]MCH1867535.1 glycosyltransferase family 4 protein [Nocardioides sp. CFH 31398]